MCDIEKDLLKLTKLGPTEEEEQDDDDDDDQGT